MTTEVANEVSFTLKDFLNEFKDEIKNKILDKLDPVYNPNNLSEWEKQKALELNKLLRKPFEVQKHSILALAKGFYKKDKKSLILTAEMGTGKTLMSIAVANLNPKINKRTLVVCPPHLAEKWVREIQITVKDAKVKILNNISDVDLSKPQGNEFWVLKNTKAKLHYQVRKLYAKKCYDCGNELDYSLLDMNFPKCDKCNTPLYAPDNKSFRRYGLSEYIKRKRVIIDFLILDEVHELKGGDTAVGQAMANLVGCSNKILAMTGTLMGGYAKNLFYILFRMFTNKFIEKGFTHKSAVDFERDFGVIQEVKVYVKDNMRNSSIGYRLKNVNIKSKPGISPLLLPEFLLENTYFMKLGDISNKLPNYTEHLIGVEMDQEQEEIYKRFQDNLESEVKKLLALGSSRLLGALVNSLYALPDGARRGEVVIDKGNYGNIVASAEPFNKYMLNKEQKLIDLIKEQKKQNKKCAVFLEHTGTRDLTNDLVERLENEDLNVLVLKSGSPDTNKREHWIKNKLKKDPNIDVLLCNPNLVKTGLDLLDFPTIIFFQTGYNIYTLRQASRRSWRIGQQEDVNVYFMYYKNTIQETAMKLIATKLETSLATEGDLTESGLTSISEGESMTIELAKSLSSADDKNSLEKVFESYRKTEKEINNKIDEDEPEIKEVVEENRKTNTDYEKAVNLAWEKAKTKKTKAKQQVKVLSVFDLLEELAS